ncbi:Tad domain-containing protein [Kordiimonas sp. SCSIO 12610]|uniref:Tad domain-containing protein n=1 Tax=Kordiimonas sp. SCSIO 12610 TaxID=2829597 RepID=UPI00210F090F|nr:Tad domain-containing protein [Kordiimonas sp. SCSIO 12610]UTW56013.1 VWA domain-containing protein [Kordiimonas sp. SCSIO 12610]
MRHHISNIHNRLQYIKQHILEDENGGLMPMMAVMMLAIVALIGLAIDGARAFYVKDVLQRSVDAAGLAAGHALDPVDSVKDAQEFFDANFAAADGVAISGSMNPTVDPENNEIINITGTATLNATFMSLFGFTSLTVDASAEITRETRGMELALVIDNTGSMSFDISPTDSRRRIDVLLPAARSLIDIVYGENDTNPNLWVSVVPFVATVNVGSVHTNFLSSDGFDRIDQPDIADTVGWQGCVFARENNLDQSDTPPNIAGIEPFVWEDTDPTYRVGASIPFSTFFVNEDNVDNRNNWKGTRFIRSCRNCTLRTISTSINETPNNTTFTDPGFDGTDQFGRFRRLRLYREFDYRGPNKACSPLPIRPLTASKQSVLNTINAMEPFGFGGTTTNFGLVWGWRTLSPRWRGFWRGGDEPSRLPLEYDEPFMDKVMVILTDGENSFSNVNQTSFGFQDDFEAAPETLEANAELELDRRLTATCNNAKDEGVIIYTIAFSSGVQQNIRDLLQDCASNPNFFFDASDGDALEDAFDTIGRQLSNLRLSR